MNWPNRSLPICWNKKFCPNQSYIYNKQSINYGQEKNHLVRHNGCNRIGTCFFGSSQLLRNANFGRRTCRIGNRSIATELFCRVQRMVYCFCNNSADLWILSGLFQKRKKLLCLIIRIRHKREKEIHTSQGVFVDRYIHHTRGPIHGNAGELRCQCIRMLSFASFQLMYIRMQDRQFGMLCYFRKPAVHRHMLFISTRNDTEKLLRRLITSTQTK